MAQPGTTKIPVGTVLAGKYRVTREIGRGGMAAVYEAENVDIGKRVAIKVLNQEFISSSVVVERFLREARAAAAIRSPFICDVYDSGRLDDQRPFLVLELLEGESLFERLTLIPFMDVPTTLAIITQVCRGLTKAHAANIVHRDLKPENIFLTHDEEGHLLAKILDFGLAKFYAPLTGPEGKAQARLTREGAVFGTPAYMSPEQVRGQGAVDHRADLWALGCITYECLTGKTVWKTEQGVAMTFAQIAGAALPKPMEARPELPAAFDGWFQKALCRDLSQRFQSAKEFSDALVQALGGRSALPESEALRKSMPPPEVPPRRQSNAPPAAAAPAVPAPAPSIPQPAPSFSAQPAPAPKFGPPPSASPVSAPAPSAPQPSQAQPISAPRAAPPASQAPPERRGAAREAQSQRHPEPSAGRRWLWGVIGVLIGFGSVGGYFTWRKIASEKPKPDTRPQSSASANPKAAGTPKTAGSGTSKSSGKAGPDTMPAWLSLVQDGQKLLTKNDPQGAMRLFREAYTKGGHGLPNTMIQHTMIGAVGAATARAPCSLNGLGRPRTFNLAPPANGKPLIFPAGRPSIAVGPKGPVMVWTDGHSGSDRVYSALLDQDLRVGGELSEVAAEAEQPSRVELLRAGDKFILGYWEGGPDAGPRLQWLDAAGKPAGPIVKAGASSVRGAEMAIDRAADGAVFTAFTKETELGCEDLFVSKLSPALELQGSPVRVTDFLPVGAGKPKVRYPMLAVSGDSLEMVFRLEREPSKAIHRIRLPLADTSKGLSDSPNEKVDRNVGEMVWLNSDKTKADAPGLVCGGDGCFALWHTEQAGGLFGAMLEKSKTQPVWRKKLSKGMRPAASASASGQIELAWYEAGNVIIATLGKAGVGTPTKVARVISDQPAPSIAAGAQAGEWYLAWLHWEAGHLEPYAARVLCR